MYEDVILAKMWPRGLLANMLRMADQEGKPGSLITKLSLCINHPGASLPQDFLLCLSILLSSFLLFTGKTALSDTTTMSVYKSSSRLAAHSRRKLCMSHASTVLAVLLSQ